MKRSRHGKSKILTQAEIQLLFSQGLQTDKDRCIFAVCLFSGCRINEACTLFTEDVYTLQGIVRSHLTIRKSNTKGKLSTRTIPIIQDLRSILAGYYPEAGKKWMFPGRYGSHIDSDSAARIFRMACQRVGIEGASTHSFRRTALTQMSDANIPLRVIAEVSGHRDLTQLQTYLEVRPEQVLGAVSALSMLSPTGVVGKLEFNDIATQELDLGVDTKTHLPQNPSNLIP